MPDYNKLAATAKRLIDKSGRDIQVVKLSKSADDAAKPWRGTVTPRSTPDATAEGKGVFVPLDSNVILGQDQKITADRRGNQMCLFAANDDGGLDLTKFDEIADSDGSRWKIVFAQLLKPGDVGIIYFFEVKR